MSRWSRLVFVVTVLALAVSGIWYTNYVDRQSDRKWCAILSTLNDATKNAPATKDPRVVTYRKQINQLWHDLGCG